MKLTADVVAPIARLTHVAAMKLVSQRRGRPDDTSDLIAILQGSSAVDVAEIRRTVELITIRGYAGGRDLHAALDEMIEIAAEPDDWG